MEKKVAMDGEREAGERGRMNLPYSPVTCYSPPATPPTAPIESRSLILTPVAVLSLLPPKLANISKEGNVGLLRAYKYDQQRGWQKLMSIGATFSQRFNPDL